MAIYDIMDEIAAKQIMKTETGDNRIFGVIVATVVKNYDEKMPGRVCIQVPVRNQEANELKWARVAMPSSGEKWGHYFLPEEGDQVLVAFEQGNIERPYIIGALPKDSNSFLKKAVHEKNQVKKITTRYGSTIQFDDVFTSNDNEKGKKDKISVFTPDKERQIILDNEKQQILISDKEKKNEILIETEPGKITVKAEKNLTIKVADNIELVLNGDSGVVSLKCDKFKVETQQAMTVQSNNKIKLEGATVSLQGSQKMDISSGAMTSISGSPIKVG